MTLVPSIDTGSSGRRAPTATSLAPGALPVTVDVVRSFGRDGIDPQEWNDLVRRSGGPVYSTHEWQSAWWECFGAGRELFMLRFRCDGGLVGLAPFFHHAAASARTLRLIGSGEAFTKSRGLLRDDGPADYLDFLVDPAHAAAVAEAFAAFLGGSRREIGRIELVNLREDSAFARLLVPALSRSEFRPRIRESERCPFVPVEAGGAAELVRSMEPGARRRYNQALRLVNAPPAGLRRIENDEAALGTVYDDLVRLHQERWNRMGYPGLFFDGRSLRFQRMITDRFAANGWLWYSALYEGRESGDARGDGGNRDLGRCVAVRLGFVFGNRLYDYLSGFDEGSEHARRRPGLGLLLTMYDDAARRGIGILDLLRGDEGYKFELTSRTARLHDATIAVSEPAGRARRAIASVASAIELGGFMAGRELRLFKVQARRYGLLRSAGRYLEFRTARLRNRMRNPGVVPDGAKGDS